ncbi:MAG: hypothetical protein ACRDA4_03175 [Filifactoraceae bacterium]
MKNRSQMPAMVEVVFDSTYLILATGFGIYFLFLGEEKLIRAWGVMALTLAIGDSFHLVPRMAAAITGNSEKYRRAMALGKLLTSITMTLFYLLLWHIGLSLFNVEFAILTKLVYLLVAIRLILLLCPQNQWTSENPSVSWGIYRNIPFFIEGMMVLVLFAKYGTDGLSGMWIAILLSFAFYIPVVLWVHKNSKLGMLMLPKTMAYVWIILMGLSI